MLKRDEYQAWYKKLDLSSAQREALRDLLEAIMQQGAVRCARTFKNDVEARLNDPYYGGLRGVDASQLPSSASDL